MDLAGILANIEDRLEAIGLSADEVSKRAGRPDSIRNLRRKVRGDGKGSFTVETLLALAPALGTTPEALLRSNGVVSPRVQEADAPALREYLVAQRLLIDRQIEAIDVASKPRRRKNR